MKKSIIYILLLSVLSLTLYYYFYLKDNNIKLKSQSTIIFKEHLLEEKKITLDSNFLISQGFFRVQENNLLFFDLSTNYVFIFDDSLKYKGFKMGYGEGPGEIETFDFHGYNELGKKHAFFSGSYIFYVFNENLDNNESELVFNWKNRKTEYKDKSAKDINKYDYSHANSIYDTKWLSVTNDRKMILPLNITWRLSPNINTLDHPGEYFKKAYPLGFYNLEENFLESGFGTYPKRYREDKYLQAFNYSYTTLSENTIYVSFMGSEEIHAYDLEGNFIESFGIKPENIKDSYPHTRNKEEYFDAVRKIRSEYGYYGHIYFDSTEDLLFRTVRLGPNEGTIVQVYSDTKLSYEFSVPERFNVIGKIGDHYIADGVIDEENNQLSVYLFKLINE